MESQENVLYLSVLPLINIGAIMSGDHGQSLPVQGTGTVQQVLTLFNDRKFATEFFPDEVGEFMRFFKSVADAQMVGGHVKGYTLQKEDAGNGRFAVKVIQHVG
jgi:hypothetical protein